MPTDDYLADYARLGLQPGCSVETLERIWRLAVRELHPDRAPEGCDTEARTRCLHELTGAYRRLRQFEREHGRLPGGMRRACPHTGDTNVAAPAAMVGDRAEMLSIEATARPRRRTGLAAMAATGIVALMVWLSAREVGGEPAPVATALTVHTEPGATRTATSASASRPGQRIRVGSTEAQVERLMGAPLVSEIDLWEYGPSHVRFQRGRVVGWYSSPLKPLPVDIESR